MALNKSEAGEIIRRLKRDEYNHGDVGIEYRIDAQDRKLDDIVRLLDLICRGEGVAS